MIISLENDALAYHGSYAGTYKISTDFNGKPSYTFGEKAIWYHKNNLWIIGLIGDLGNSVMRAKNEFAGLTDSRNHWRYWYGLREVNDINVQCTQDFECNEIGSLYGNKYDPKTGSCTCKPGWYGDICHESKFKIYLNLIYIWR